MGIHFNAYIVQSLFADAKNSSVSNTVRFDIGTIGFLIFNLHRPSIPTVNLDSKICTKRFAFNNPVSCGNRGQCNLSTHNLRTEKYPSQRNLQSRVCTATSSYSDQDLRYIPKIPTGGDG